MTPERAIELDRTTIDIKYVESLPQYPDSSADKHSQVRALEALCARFGLWDACTTLRWNRDMTPVAVRPVEVIPMRYADIKHFSQVQSATDDQLEALELVARRFGMVLAADHVAAMRKPVRR